MWTTSAIPLLTIYQKIVDNTPVKKIQTFVTDKGFAKLKALAKRHGVSMGRIIDRLLEKLEVPEPK